MSKTSRKPVVRRGEETPGIAIEAVFNAGFCAAGRIVVHQGIRIDDSPGGMIGKATNAESFYFAFYPQEILANGQQPHDQPMLAAYLPLK
ncbi:MAG TPA: hypothetical protein VHL59_08255, partial [Thermoanaerobaculia bacterium]|nr:hypothetical protein [Thermoanaerobaculia bacterium]